MKLKPFGGLVLIKILPEEAEASTTGGVIMPSTIDQSRTPRICEIVAMLRYITKSYYSFL